MAFLVSNTVSETAMINTSTINILLKQIIYRLFLLFKHICNREVSYSCMPIYGQINPHHKIQTEVIFELQIKELTIFQLTLE